MVITHNSRRYMILCFAYPRRGNLYYDAKVNRVKTASRNFCRRKHIIVADVTGQ